MSTNICLTHPEYLQIKSDSFSGPDASSPAAFWGGSQEWFITRWQRQAGCGPTVCALLFWYLAKTQPQCKSLCRAEGNTQQEFLAYMEQLWKYITPGAQGVNTSRLFVEGALDFAKQQDVALSPHILEIPKRRADRPSVAGASSFLEGALSRNLPVAFLNLSNGSLNNLDSWHWVTLAGITKQPFSATMIDAGSRTQIPLARWLNSTFLGGSMVFFKPLPRA